MKKTFIQYRAEKMLDITMEDLYLTALNRSIRNIELRLRTNKSMDWTELTDSQRKWWKEQLRNKQKMFRRVCKKYGKINEYNAYIEKEALREMEERRLAELEEIDDDLNYNN